MDKNKQVQERDWASEEYLGLAPTTDEIKGQEHIDLGYPVIEEYPYGAK